MIGNAVPIRMATILAKKIIADLSAVETVQIPTIKRWETGSNMIEHSVAI